MKSLRIVALATVAIMAISANATPTVAKTTTTAEVGRVVHINDLERTPLAGQAVGIKEVDNCIWLVSFMD